MNLDYTALTRPLTPEDREVYKKSTGSHGRAGLILSMVVISLLVVIFASAFVQQTAQGYDFSLASIVLAGFAMVISFIAVIGYLSKKRRIRLFLFARANNLVYIKDRQLPGYVGMIYTTGHGREVVDALRLTNGIEIGNYRYETGSGRSRRTHTWGYMRVQLVRHLPHMVLDAKKNNLFGILSSLPQSLAGHQTLGLEGNFNDHFTLYVPKGYERDAYYVFTPDVMVKLIDFGANHDIEVIDNNLILFSRKTIALHDERTLKKYIEISEAIATELIDQADYYADEAVGDRNQDFIAEPGRRLKTRLSVGSIVVFVLIILYLLYTTLN
jgi:hypothetical protein